MLRLSSTLQELTSVAHAAWKPDKLFRQRPSRRTKQNCAARAHKILVNQKTQKVMDETLQSSNLRDLKISQLTDQIFSKGLIYTGCASNVSFVPDGNPAIPEVALVGRERCGKTSLLRALGKSSRNISPSNRGGRSDVMNFFNVGRTFNITETPGYGGTRIPWIVVLQHATVIRNFVRFRPNLKMVYYCMDIHPFRGVPYRDLDMLKFMSSEIPNFTIVLTKVDRLSHSDFRFENASGAKTNTTAAGEAGDEENFDMAPNNAIDQRRWSTLDVRSELIRHGIEHPVIATSAFDLGGIDTLRFDMVLNAVHSLPTEKLSLKSCQALSNRLFTQDEWAAIAPPDRVLSLPTYENDDDAEWERALDEELKLDALEEEEESQKKTAAVPVARHVELPGAPVTTGLQLPSRGDESKSVVLSTPPQSSLKHFSNALRKLRTPEILHHIARTNPLRNPLWWPTHIMPTRNRRVNIVRSPSAPQNPYLEQPHFVSTRVELVFRKPNVGCMNGPGKGLYEPKMGRWRRRYTLPFFPDITDIPMFPPLEAFVGSPEAFYETSGGKTRALQLLRQGTKRIISALFNLSELDHPDLKKELSKLEEMRSMTTKRQQEIDSGHDDATTTTAGCPMIALPLSSVKETTAAPSTPQLRATRKPIRFLKPQILLQTNVDHDDATTASTPPRALPDVVTPPRPVSDVSAISPEGLEQLLDG